MLYGSIRKPKQAESNYLLSSQSDETASDRVSFSRVPIIIGLVISFVGVIVLSTVRRYSDTDDSSSVFSSIFSRDQTLNANQGTVVVSTSEIEFTVARDGYDALDLHHDFLKYEFMATYDGVIEPYVPMNLIVTNGDSSTYYKYSVCRTEESTDRLECEYGMLSTEPDDSVAVTLECDAFDELPLSIIAYDVKTNEEISTTTGTFVCMYVRREIRSLTSDDLDDMLDAMHTMWAVGDSEGREIYGDNYHDAVYLLEFHHFNAAFQDGDHVHEGNGFLPQHIKMTNIFELAMQAVNPAVTLPYWDFTIDSAEDLPVAESYVMNEDIFGSMTYPVDERYGFTYKDDSVLDAAIPDGRWAYIKADKNKKYTELMAGFNYMRAPWNMNPSPYVSRFTANMMIGTMLPSCSSHYTLLENTDLMDFIYGFAGDPHATAHSLVGGTYGCDMLDPLLDAGYINDETALLSICASWVFYLKEFYRYNYITPNSDCDATDPDDVSCGFTCVDDTEDDLLFSLKNKISINVPSDMDDDGWDTWVDFVCTGDGQKIFSGDHLESASPSDPSFWPIHTTLDRLVHAKYMSGGFVVSAWATDPINDYVCDKAYCYDTDNGGWGYHSTCCYGHYQYDRLLDAVNGNKSGTFGLTNDYILKASDPTSLEYSMPYIYDGFTWDHCEEDFPGLLVSLSQGSMRRKML